MKAILIHQYGGPEVLMVEEVPRPEPVEGEILVRVHAAGVNPVDWKVREGFLDGFLHHKLPLILGWDVSGVVESVGPGVTSFHPGDAVFSRPDIGRDGAYAEFMVMRANEATAKPPSLTHIQAAAVPLAALTAWQVMFDAGQLKAGQTVLIHAASGGVGSFAVQMAKAAGARVVATCSARNSEFVKSLGADELIDYQSSRFEEVAQDIDVVFDTMGGDTQERSWNVLKPGGRLVSIASTPSSEEASKHQATGHFVFVQPNAEQLATIGKWIEEGKIRPIIETVLPLADVRKAHEQSQTGRTRGKIVLQVV